MAGVSLMTGGKGKSERCSRDFYPTPDISTKSLLESGYLDNNLYEVLEPCAGKNNIGKLVKQYHKNCEVKAVDLYDYGEPSVESGIDFLQWKPNKKYDWVITNPPYDSKLLIPFVEKSLAVAEIGVAMSLKITFLESIKRYDFFTSNMMLKNVLVFSNRQPMYKNGINTGTSNAICYAWFIWRKDYVGQPTIDWLRNDKNYTGD